MVWYKEVDPKCHYFVSDFSNRPLLDCSLKAGLLFQFPTNMWPNGHCWPFLMSTREVVKLTQLFCLNVCIKGKRQHWGVMVVGLHTSNMFEQSLTLQESIISNMLYLMHIDFVWFWSPGGHHPWLKTTLLLFRFSTAGQPPFWMRLQCIHTVMYEPWRQ